MTWRSHITKGILDIVWNILYILAKCVKLPNHAISEAEGEDFGQVIILEVAGLAMHIINYKEQG